MKLRRRIYTYIIYTAVSSMSLSASAATTTVNFDDDDETTDLFLKFAGIEDATAHLFDDDTTATSLIDYANEFLGTPYRRGAKGPSAFDCSGFTSYIFRKFDMRLGASSRDQYRQGEAIETKDIKPGDLLFFSRGRNNTVGHVGIAIEVKDDGKIIFIHAARRGGIRIDKYPDGGYYSRHYVGARRVISN